MYTSFVNYGLAWKVNVIGYEYPGYGIAKGSASPSIIKKDINTVYNFVTTILKFLPQNVIFYGRSIGTGPSTYMASRITRKNKDIPAALILQSPYTSIRDIAKELVGAIGTLAPKMFNNIGNISHVKCPIMLIHGERDDVIPVTHSDFLEIHVTHENFEYVKLPNADHNEFDEKNDIINPVKAFLDRFRDVQGEDIGSVPEWLYQKLPIEINAKEEKETKRESVTSGEKSDGQ